MKTLKKQIRFIALSLALLLLFQSCKAYHSNSVTLEQASQEFKRTKIQTKNNEILKYRGVKFEDTKYFGIKKVNGNIVNVPIDENFIKTVRLENETMSTILTIALPVVILGAALGIAAASLSDLGTGWSSWGTGSF